MEVRKYGSAVEVWKYGSMEVPMEVGSMEVPMEVWKYGSMEVWKCVRKGRMGWPFSATVNMKQLSPPQDGTF